MKKNGMQGKGKKKPGGYLLALKYDWLTTLYDPLIKFGLRETAFKRRLIAQAKLKRDQRILDLGCGTGTLLTMIREQYPKAHLTGVDGDPKILEIARKKSKKRNLKMALDQALSSKLPYPDGSFDRVVSSLFFHHLDSMEKKKTFREIFRVLKRGGELHIADWGKAQNLLMRALFFSVQVFDGFKTTQDHVDGLLPNYLLKAGFGEVEEKNEFMTILGTLSFFSAKKK